MGVRIRLHHGAWYVFVNHRRQRKAFRCGSERDAQKFAARAQVALVEGRLLTPDPDAPPLTLRGFVTAWRANTTLKSSTRRGYDANLDQHILPVLGHRLLRDIDRSACKALLAACRAKTDPPLKGKTLANVARTLSTILTEAVEQGYLTGNPAFRLGRFCRREDEIPYVIQPLTREELATLLGAARDHAPHAYAPLLTLARTGLRLGELLALEWGDIDFHGGFVRVARNRVQGKVTTPKSGKSRRVDLSPQLSTELQRLLVRRKADALRAGHAMPATVFLSPNGQPLDADNFRTRVWEPLLAKAGLRAFRLHDLRHTFASMLIAQGESLAYVRDQLGHSSIKITVDVYGHLIPGANRAAVAALDDTPLAPTCNPAQPGM